MPAHIKHRQVWRFQCRFPVSLSDGDMDVAAAATVRQSWIGIQNIDMSNSAHGVDDHTVTGQSQPEF
jgi:hypothetical protein